MTRFSIVITCYNQSAFIRDAIGSALAQDYADKEIIIVDDGSTDGSRKVLEEYGAAIKLQALETNQGACRARNCGASLATGDFLVFLDGDDMLQPWAFSIYRRVVELRNPSLIIARLAWFHDEASLSRTRAMAGQLRFVEYEHFIKKDRPVRASASAFIVQRHAFEAVGGWTNDIFPWEDQDLLIKLALSGRTIQILSPATIAYRVHARNSIHQVREIVRGVYGLIRREKMGMYPGGRRFSHKRHALIGGFAFFCLKKAFRTKLYGEGFNLLRAGWPMICAAISRRCLVILRGRSPEMTLDSTTDNERHVS